MFDFFLNIADKKIICMVKEYKFLVRIKKNLSVNPQ